MANARQEVKIVKSRYVGNVPFFSTLSEEEQERISQRMHLERRRSGESLFRKGDLCTALYLIKSGWVRLTANGGTSLASQGPGSLVGETDLFLDQPHSLGAMVATDAELWVLSRQDLIDLIAETPSIGLKLSLAFGARLALLDQYLIEQRLRPLPFLAGLKDQALAAIARRLVPLEKKRGELIVESGQPPEALFLIESGRVHLHSSEEGGDFAELGEGETFGEMALLTGKPHVRTAQAATDVVLWALPAAEFEPLTADYPEVRLALSQSLHGPLLAQDMGRAIERLATMPLFAGLSEEVLWAVAQRLLLRHVPAGELIFAEGSPGDALFLIDSGQVELTSGGKAGRAALARLGADEFFGETALLTGKPRSTAARAATHTNLWVLYRSDFDDLVNRYPSISLALSRVLSQRLAEMDRRFTEGHLRGLRLLAGLSPGQLEEISRRLRPVRFRQGETILREGEAGEELFFIEAGRVQVVRGQEGRLLLLAELEAGDLFGEMALLTGAPRSATVTALSDVDLWVLSKADFDDVVTAYPNLALALSRLLSERLRNTDAHFLKQPAAAAAAPSRAAPRAAPATQPRPAPRARPARRRAGRSLGRELVGAFDSLALWFGGLSSWAKVRLVLVVLLLAYLLCVAAPWLVVRTLAAADVTNLQGAIAFVQVVPPTAVAVPPAASPLAAAVAPPQQASPAPVEASGPPQETPVAQPSTEAQPPEAPANPVGEPVQGSPEPTQEPPTPTPWIIVITNTPLPPTDTPLPPTETPLPPTPVPFKANSRPPAPTATPVPVERPQPPRNLDPRLASLKVEIVPAGVRPGQYYWRLIEARWQNEAEAGGDHTIYVQVLDENGNRLIGQPVEIRWPGGSLNIFTEDKPPPEYGGNFPMYNTLGSYSVSVPGLPSDTIVGLGMGTAEQPAFTVHTNFFLTFQRVKR